MKRFFSLFTVVGLMIMCFAACSNSESVFDNIEIVDDEYSLDNVIIGTSTFLETEKIYPKVDVESFKIEENQTFVDFTVDYNLKIDGEEIPMTKIYSYVCEDWDFHYVKEDGIVNYNKVNGDYYLYENYKDYICGSVDIISNEAYSLEEINKIVDTLISQATQKFGSPNETVDSSVLTDDEIKIAYWHLDEASTLGIGSRSNNDDTFDFAIIIYKNNGYRPCD